MSERGESIFDRQPAGGSDWVGLYTKPRQEKSLATDLASLGVDYFLPLVTRISISGGRRRKAQLPLFPSYVFASVPEKLRVPVARTQRIVQTLRPEQAQVDRFVRELQAIESAVLTCPEQIELQPRLVDGVRARVVGGAMRGTEGLVVKSNNRSKIWLQVTTLGTGVLVEIESDLLEAID